MWRMISAKESEKPLIMPISKTLTNLNTLFSSPTPSPYCGYLLGNDFSAVNQQFSDEQQKKSKRGGSISIKMEEVSMGAARWTPTPEQLYALEEIYQRGTRTPSANQIQQIALRLGRFGKIEGKNVFYWFQNHKARERQKRRRQQFNNRSLPNEQHLRLNNIQNSDIKFSGLTRTNFEVGEAKNWVTPSSDCSTISEESVSLPAATESAKGERIRRLRQKTSSSSSITAMPRIMANQDINTRKHQTLELFPDWNWNSDDHRIIRSPKFNNSEVPIVNTNNFTTPTHFFEFL